MEAMAREWTDDRLDVLSERVDLGFKSVDERFALVDQRFDEVDRRFEQVDRRFEQVDKRFAQVDKRFGEMIEKFDKVDTDIRELRGEIWSMRRLMTQGVMGICGVMVTGFVAVFAAIVTQL